jgi:SAM-dependent methyltransferase
MEAIEYERMDAAEGRMWWYRALHENLLAALRDRPGPDGSSILDAGCGTGGFLSRLADAAPGRRLLGVDASPAAVACSRAKSTAPVAIANVHHLPFPDRSMGVVFSVDVLYHREVDPRTAIAEAFRCLMPAGVLIVNVPAFQWLTSSHDRQVHGARRFDRPGLRRLLEDQGFSEVRVGYWNSLLFPLMVLRRKLMSSAADTSDVGEFPGLIDRLFGAIMAAERGMSRFGVRYPFGGSLLAVARK